MDDTNATPADPGSDSPTSPPAEEAPQQHRIVDLAALLALLGLAAAVYLAVGDAGFSVITSAVVGLFGTWRARR